MNDKVEPQSTITEAGLRFDLFVMHAWERLVIKLDSEICDDPHRLMSLKTAFWSGAATYRAAIETILESGQDDETMRKMRTELDNGLTGFTSSLNPLRRLDA